MNVGLVNCRTSSGYSWYDDGLNKYSSRISARVLSYRHQDRHNYIRCTRIKLVDTMDNYFSPSRNEDLSPTMQHCVSIMFRVYAKFAEAILVLWQDYAVKSAMVNYNETSVSEIQRLRLLCFVSSRFRQFTRCLSAIKTTKKGFILLGVC